jgi:adenylate kinase family enzyme
MVVKVFVFGCPGSGKSTASASIELIAQDNLDKWSTFRINDYEILDCWFHEDKIHERFRPIEYGGFDILISEIYDEALEILKDEVLKYQSSRENELIIIEFARCDYKHALEQLGNGFIQNAYFLFLEADFDTCIQRIHDRVHHQVTLDDHFVSDFVLECYDQPNNVSTNISLLKTTFGIDNWRIKTINNSKNCELVGFNNEMKNFVDYIIKNCAELMQAGNLDSNNQTLQFEDSEAESLISEGQLEHAGI